MFRLLYERQECLYFGLVAHDNLTASLLFKLVFSNLAEIFVQ